MSLCMCGALDCFGCHPENFTRIDGQWVYVDYDSDPAEEDLDDTEG